MSVVCCKIGKFKENCDSSDSKKDKTLVYTRTRARIGNSPLLFHICFLKRSALVARTLVGRVE